METRGLRQTEMAEMIALQCLVFRADGQERYRRYIREDSSYDWKQTRVGVEDARIVSTLRIWDRVLQVGSRSVRMGGVGGVVTHPDFRGAGRGSELVSDAAAYMQRSGYHIAALFSEIPCRFYRRLGWASLPRAFFRLEMGRVTPSQQREWQVEPFIEERDLEAVIKLYDHYNVAQSGALVRTRPYWEMAPSRIRGLLPTVVALRDGRCGGYLNYEIAGQNARVLEVTSERGQPAVLAALVDQFLQVCARRGVREISGEIPHRHPLVEQLAIVTDGDLHLGGDLTMMLYAVDLAGLLEQVLPELQERLDAGPAPFAPAAFRFALNEQQCVLQLSAAGKLAVVDSAANALPLDMPASFFWRLLLGESSWKGLAPTLQTCGLLVPDAAAAVLDALFPQREVIFWGPDHF